MVQIFPYGEAEPLVTSVNPEIPDAAFVRRENPIVAAALAGERSSLVEGSGSDVGDVVRGAVPIYSSDAARPKEVVGALVVNYLVPFPLAAKIDEIRAAADQYREVQPYAGHLVWVYQIELLLCSLVMLLLALWWGFRMAKGVTQSISALAEGTAEVARGNLDVAVEPQSDDEVGFLVRSFNRMTRDLREARGSLEQSAAELDRRRRYMEIVLRNVGAGVVSLDADGRIGTINPPAQRFLGLPPGASAVGHKLEEVVTRPEYLDVVAELSAQTRAGVRESVRRQVQIPDGRGGADPARHAHADPGRRRPPARHGGGVRRLHPGGARPAHGGLARGGAPHRPRDQEPADADPALRAAHPPAPRSAAHGPRQTSASSTSASRRSGTRSRA